MAPSRRNADPKTMRDEDAPDGLERDRDDPAETDARNTKLAFRLLQDRLSRLPPGESARLRGTFVQELLEDSLQVDTRHGPIRFVPMGKRAAGRGHSLLTKQPATIAWIDGFTPESVFWDIGANVGAYTVYAASRGDIRVVAFEPAANNYFTLAANCEANGVTHLVDCLLMGVGRERRLARIDVSQFDLASSFVFRRPKREDRYRHSQTALMVSIDDAIETFELPCPNYIKIDAPSFSMKILEGGLTTLARPEMRELHIEADEKPELVALLQPLGFTLAGRHEHGHGTVDVTFVKANQHA